MFVFIFPWRKRQSLRRFPRRAVRARQRASWRRWRRRWAKSTSTWWSALSRATRPPTTSRPCWRPRPSCLRMAAPTVCCEVGALLLSPRVWPESLRKKQSQRCSVTKTLDLQPGGPATAEVDLLTHRSSGWRCFCCNETEPDWEACKVADIFLLLCWKLPLQFLWFSCRRHLLLCSPSSQEDVWWEVQGFNGAELWTQVCSLACRGRSEDAEHRDARWYGRKYLIYVSVLRQATTMKEAVWIVSYFFSSVKWNNAKTLNTIICLDFAVFHSMFDLKIKLLVIKLKNSVFRVVAWFSHISSSHNNTLNSDDHFHTLHLYCSTFTGHSKKKKEKQPCSCWCFMDECNINFQRGWTVFLNLNSMFVPWSRREPERRRSSIRQRAAGHPAAAQPGEETPESAPSEEPSAR